MLQKARETVKKANYVKSFLTKRMLHVNLQLLYNCNFRCEICDFWHEDQRDRPMLSLEQVKLISTKLATIGPQIVSIGGGEPMLHKQITEVVRALSRYHFPVMICNGWFITHERARALWEAGMYEISVSIDYTDPAKHDKQRGKPGAWERGMAALQTLHDTRTRTDQRVHMISVIMDDNLDDVETLIEHCKRMGITYLVTLYSEGRGAKSSRQAGHGVSERLLDIKGRNPEFVVLRDYIGNFGKAIREGGIGPCFAGRNLMNIDSQGDVSLCIDRLDDKVGNILTDDMAVLEQKLQAQFEANSCIDCWTSCRGSIESIMRARTPGSAMDYWQMTRRVPLGKAFGALW